MRGRLGVLGLAALGAALDAIPGNPGPPLPPARKPGILRVGADGAVEINIESGLSFRCSCGRGKLKVKRRSADVYEAECSACGKVYERIERKGAQ